MTVALFQNYHRHPPSAFSPQLPGTKPHLFVQTISAASVRKRLLFIAKASSVGNTSASEFSDSAMGPTWTMPRSRRRIAGVDQEELFDPEQLAEPDSLFCELNGVRIHHKVCHFDGSEQVGADLDSDGRTRPPMILLHGFGASVFSWSLVMQPLARLIGSKVLAFDRPAFGLTSRESIVDVKDHGALNPYSMAFSVLATLSFLDMMNAEKVIIMGHSAGCLVAVNAYFEAPERVAALILVAPAIFAPVFARNSLKEHSMKGEYNETERNAGGNENVLVWIWRAVCKFFSYAVANVVQMCSSMGAMVGSLCYRTLAVILRSALAVMLVRFIMDKFGVIAVRNSFFDSKKVTNHVIQGYTKPLKSKNWEKALLEFTLAILTDSTMRPPVSKKLSKISCPVLVVTGDTDRLVPSWNAEKVARAIPGATFEVIPNCGHMPQEEQVEDFTAAVAKFLRSSVEVSHKWVPHAAP